jgi:DNA repair protein RecN (Recombination protein N)
MLRQLQIEDYALIDRVEVEFGPGLNLLTGETGSGKSIVVEAVGLLLGDKGSSELIRSGAARARIAGVFSPQGPVERPVRRTADGNRKGAARMEPAASERWRTIGKLLDESGIEIAEGDELILQRELLPGSRSRVFINNQPATVGLLRTLATWLAEVHGQNEQQELFQQGAQLEALDRFGGLLDTIRSVGQRFAHWKELRRRLEQFRLESQEALRQRDLWEFQKREIEQAGIVEGEQEQLEEEKRLLAHAGRIQSRLASCYDLLYDAPNSAVATIGSAQRQMEEISAVDPALSPLAETLEGAKASVEDLALTVRDRLTKLDASPARLEEVENRLALLDRLKRKYAMSLEDIAAYGQNLSRKIERLDSGEAEIQRLEAEVKSAASAYASAAGALSTKRTKAAKDLNRAVERELAELAMSGTVFEAQIANSAAEADWRPSGFDTVEFLISPNPGEPLRPLARIASGGETSRIMLALETVIAGQPAAGGAGSSPTHALIFDEVDAGIGGRAAETVGRKLRKLGESRQVLCVTHLPQIASFAHHHFRVEKTVRDGRTVTQVSRLQGEERRRELARMLSGSQISPAVLEHAAQLLKTNAE